MLLLGPVATGKVAPWRARSHAAAIACSPTEVAAVSDGLCHPAGSLLSLADDALTAAGIAPEELPQYTNFPIPKRLWAAGPRPEPRPYPISAVLRLVKAEPDAANQPERLEGEAARRSHPQPSSIGATCWRAGHRSQCQARSGATLQRRRRFIASPSPAASTGVEEVADRIVALSQSQIGFRG